MNKKVNCLALLALAALLLAAESEGKWLVFTEKSPMDDSEMVTLRLNAEGEIYGPLRKKVTPALFIACREKGTVLYINTEMPADVENAEGEHTVEIRLDSQKSFKEKWGESTDHEALFAPNAVYLARKMQVAHFMLFKFVPFDGTPQIASFHLEGLSVLLPRIQKACRWNLPLIEEYEKRRVEKGEP